MGTAVIRQKAHIILHLVFCVNFYVNDERIMAKIASHVPRWSSFEYMTVRKFLVLRLAVKC